MEISCFVLFFHYNVPATPPPPPPTHTHTHTRTHTRTHKFQNTPDFQKTTILQLPKTKRQCEWYKKANV